MSAYIRTPIEDAKLVAREKFAWPGGYALFLVLSDGATICPECVRCEFKSIAYSTRNRLHDGWRAEALDHTGNTDEEVTCDHCGRVIE